MKSLFEDLGNLEDDEEMVEINDFTIVNDLEAFCLSIENAIVQMKEELVKHGSKLFKGKFSTSSEITTSYKDVHFRLDFFKYQNSLQTQRNPETSNDPFSSEDLIYLCDGAKQLLSLDADFSDTSPITCQYGVHEYLLMTPITHGFLINEENYNDIMSAVNPAILNTECNIPFFVQFGDPSRALFFGTCLNIAARTVFEGAHLRTSLYKHRFLDNLMDVFKEKVNAPPNAERKIYVSIQLDYNTRKLQLNKLGEGIDDNDDTEDMQKPCEHVYPIGADMDPFDQLNLFALWPKLAENDVNENENFSELDLMCAPRWMVSVGFHGDAKYHIYSLYSDLLELRDSHLGYTSLTISRKFNAPSDTKSKKHVDAAAALARLAEDDHFVVPHFSIEAGTKLLGSALSVTSGSIKRSKKEEFGETHDGQKRHPCIEFILKRNAEESMKNEVSSDDDFLKECYKSLETSKTAPKGSVTRSIARCLALKLAQENEKVGIEDFRLLWAAFLDLLRERWEKIDNLPGFDDPEKESQAPDLSTSLLHQKLQMLQFCIATRRKREKEAISASIVDVDEMETDGDEEAPKEEEEDEFFDANESFSAAQNTPKVQKLDRAVGVDKLLDPLGPSTCLLNYPDRAIAVPITQDRGPMTEDMLDKYAEFLGSLSDGDERTSAQLDTLVSDMQAFKAANPGCVLEDFIRWHSPRDWIQFAEDSPKGELSERMRISGNIWKETWDKAKAIPVSKQPRLFNETNEVNSILQYFSNLQIRDLIALILPAFTVDILERLIDEIIKCRCLKITRERLQQICSLVSRGTRQMDFDDFYAMKSGIEFLECILSRYKSLDALFSKQNMLDAVVESDDGTHAVLADPETIHEFILELLQPSETLGSTMAAPISSDKPWTTRKVRVVDAPRGALASLIRTCMVENEDASQRAFDEEESSKTRSCENQKMPESVRKQYVFRWILPHPGPGSRLMPQRMYTSIAKNEFRLCGSFTSDTTYI